MASPELLESFVVVATAAFEELHTTDCRICVLLSANVPVAANFCPVPAGIVGVAGVTAIETRFGGIRLFVSYSSALAGGPERDVPPTIRTIPFLRSVAVVTWRATFKLPVGTNIPLEGTYSSELAKLSMAL